MNLWIDIARDSLVAAIESVDCVILNDAELRQLTGKPNLVSAAREILSWGRRGPRVIVAKQGEYGAALMTRGGLLRAARRIRWRRVIDPTGAGDTFAGGLVGYIAAHPQEELSDDAAAPRDGARDRARVVQRRGVRNRARRAPHRRGDRRAHRGAARDDPVQRRTAAAARLSVALLRCAVVASLPSADCPRGPCTDPSTGIRSTRVTTWTFIWLMVILKIPIVALFMIVRWAVTADP